MSHVIFRTYTKNLFVRWTSVFYLAALLVTSQHRLNPSDQSLLGINVKQVYCSNHYFPENSCKSPFPI